jgi:chitin disaccharide deacetylase
MQIIVNADDLGLSAPVNEAIFDTMERGYVTSSTMLANGAAIEEAVSQSRRFKHCSFGVHLNVTEFHPLTKNADLSPILKNDGSFAGGGETIRSLSISSKLRQAIFEEWSAQINRLVALGLTPSHIDSHHLVHTMPALFPVLKRVQRRFGIRKVRITKNIYPTSANKSRALMFGKVIWNAALRRYFPTVTTDGFTALDDFVDAVKDQQIRGRTLELMVHPGNPLFERETELLVGSWRERLPFKTDLISFNDLAK